MNIKLLYLLIGISFSIAKIERRIRNGDQVTRDSEWTHPYAVAIMSFDDDFVASGTIIDTYWILTVRLSIWNLIVFSLKFSSKSANPLVGFKTTDLFIFATKDYSHGVDEKSGEWASYVKEIVIHEQFDPFLEWNNQTKPPHDIAMLKTRLPMKFVKNKIQPAQLPLQWHLTQKKIEKLQFSVAGFGSTDDSQPIKEKGPLYVGKVQGITNQDCKNRFPNLENSCCYFCTAAIDETKPCDE